MASSAYTASRATSGAAFRGPTGPEDLMPADRPAFVGRDRELRTALNVLRSSAGPGGVLLAGAPGVGKTRLGEEVVAALSATAAPGEGRAPDRSAATGSTARHVDRLFPAAVTRSVHRLLRSGSSRPRTLWIDDAHLLSAEAAEALRELTHQGGHKVLLAMNTAEGHPRLHSLWKDQRLARVELAPLDVLSTRRLASALFGDRLSQPGVVRLAAMSDGNPLLLRELARAALAQNLIGRDGAGWRLGGGIPVSDALRELVTRRLAVQSDESRQALELIALAEPARLDAVERIVPADTLLRLEDAGLVRVSDPRAEQTPDTPRSAEVAHPYVGHVLRQDVGPLRRRHYLRLWTGAAPREALAPAERVRLAQWHLDAGDLPQNDLLCDGVEYALHDHDIPAATRLSAAAWDSHPTVRAAELRARALFAAGVFEDLHAFVEKVSVEHSDYVSRLAPVQARAFLFDGRSVEADRTAHDLTGRQRTAFAALSAFFRGHFAEALDEARRVLRDPASACRAEAGLLAMDALCRLGRPLDALDLYTELRNQARSGEPTRSSETDALEEAHALAQLRAGRLDEAEGILLREYRTTIERRRIGADAQRGLALGIVLLERGRVREALPLFSFTPAYQVGWRPWHARAALHTVIALNCLPAARHGRPEQPLDDLGAGPYAAELAVARAWQAHRRGEQEQARRLLHTAVDAALDVGNHGDAVVLLHESARLGLPAHWSVAEDLPVQGPYLRGRLHYARAVDAGDAKLLGQACRALTEAGAQLYAAEGYAELARLHHRAGRSRAATASTVQARTLLRQCGEVVTPPLHFLGDAAALSARERTMARLAAQGLTDKEIAHRLVVSPRTVSNTLYRVYQKVGASDRRHLRRLLSL
ncbi:LuxR C-terminal-related transcriptional regulator [Streptomyces sp. NPDC059866]|uniref:helix-turn-helix transcriptional regulator n=1 Tax=Streptomyces sp. NPDC059866 TaxID=3346978 RepID=UPI00366319EA